MTESEKQVIIDAVLSALRTTTDDRAANARGLAFGIGLL